MSQLLPGAGDVVDIPAVDVPGPDDGDQEEEDDLDDRVPLPPALF